MGQQTEYGTTTMASDAGVEKPKSNSKCILYTILGIVLTAGATVGIIQIAGGFDSKDQDKKYEKKKWNPASAEAPDTTKGVQTKIPYKLLFLCQVRFSLILPYFLG